MTFVTKKNKTAVLKWKHKISIIIPTYNRAEYLKQSIESALTQTYTQYEVLVVDDGSTDNTKEIIDSFKSERLRHIKKEHSGAPATRNRGIKEAKGEFIIWLGSDDILMPEAIATYMKALKKFPTVDVFYGNILVTDEKLNKLMELKYLDWYKRNAELLTKMFNSNCIPDGGSMIKKDCFTRVGGYDEAFLRAHDYEFWVRLIKFAQFKYIDQTILKWRWHGKNMSSGTIKIDTNYDIRVIYKMLALFSLKELFPNIGWKFFLFKKKVEAKALLKVANRLNNLDDLRGAFEYAKKSQAMIPSQRAQNFLDLVIAKVPDMQNKFQKKKSDKMIKGYKKLNLLFVVHSFPPKAVAGTELYTLSLAKEFKKKGHIILVLYPIYEKSRPEGLITKGEFEKISVSQINLNHPSDLTQKFKNIAAAKAFEQFLLDLDVDLVHFHHFMGFSALSLDICKRKNIPTIMTIHDTWLLCEQIHFIMADGTFCKNGPETVEKCVQCFLARYPNFLKKGGEVSTLANIFTVRLQFLKKAFNQIDTIIAPSKFIRNVFFTHGFINSNVIDSPLGIPTFPIVPRKHDKRNYIRFCFLGNINFTKGLDILISAFNSIDNKKVKLNLYGKIIDTIYFKQIMGGKKKNVRIKYHGKYKPKDLPKILAQTDVAVCPSRSENYPTVIRECLHSKIPVIAANVGGIPEIIKDGKNGLLFRASDPKDLAKKLHFFIEEPQRILEFRKNIRPVRKITDEVKHLEQIYFETLQQTTTKPFYT